MAGVLQPARGRELEQVAHVQARRGRVEAHIEPHAPGREGLAQRAEIRRVGDEAAPLEVVQQGRVDASRRAFRVGSVGASLPHRAGAALHLVPTRRPGIPAPLPGTLGVRRRCPTLASALRAGGTDVDRRQVRARSRDRARRHGRGLARPRHGARARGRAEADRDDARAPARPTSSAPSARRASPPGSTTPTWWRSSTWSPRASETWLVMEYVEGVTLSALVKRDGALAPDEAAPLVRPGGRRAGRRARGRHRAPRREAVQHAGHARTGEVKLTDFGIARAEADASLTQTGLVTGSPAYLAPEVASGATAPRGLRRLVAGRHALPRPRRPAAVRRRART